jgi:AAA15 family ATPase/GTPase
MLLRFRFSNFRSFRDEQEFSLVAGRLKDGAEGLVEIPSLAEPALCAAALYGANASGKTNLVKALEFMAGAVQYSHTRWQPDSPIDRNRFAASPQDQPSDFEVDFMCDGCATSTGFPSMTDRSFVNG